MIPILKGTILPYYHIPTMICSANQLTGFYIMETLVVKGLISKVTFLSNEKRIRLSLTDIYMTLRYNTM